MDHFARFLWWKPGAAGVQAAAALRQLRNPGFEERMNLAEKIMRGYRDTLHALAK
jgi:hypothetical protein